MKFRGTFTHLLLSGRWEEFCLIYKVGNSYSQQRPHPFFFKCHFNFLTSFWVVGFKSVGFYLRFSPVFEKLPIAHPLFIGHASVDSSHLPLTMSVNKNICPKHPTTSPNILHCIIIMHLHYTWPAWLQNKTLHNMSSHSCRGRDWPSQHRSNTSIWYRSGSTLQHFLENS